MAHHKKYKKHSKKHSKKNSSSDHKSTSCKTHHESHHKSHHNYHHNHHHKPHCCCEQLFYAPLPNLPSRPPTQTVTPSEWFAPGSVQSCCSICSSVKPVYASPCTGYCCRQY